jgi:CheY-like chemotaxis protein
LLHVEDNPDDAQFVARLFEKAGYEVAWTRAQSEAEYRSALAPPPQAVIADYSLPRFTGLQALEILKQTAPDVPFILVTGTIGEERAAEIMRLGASDYLLKERLARLPVAVERAVREAEQRVADRKAKAEAEAGLRRLNRVYAVLSAINSAIVRIRDRQALLDECCRIAVGIGRFVAAWIGMVSGDATVVTPVAFAGAVRDVVDAAPLGLDSEHSGYRHAIAIAIRSKVTVVANSLEEDASKVVSSALREAGIQAYAADSVEHRRPRRRDPWALRSGHRILRRRRDASARRAH